MAAPGPRATAALLGLLLLAVALDRWLTLGEAVERDLAAYMVVAGELLAGRTLYVEAWDHKPPAIHLTYAAARLTFGPTDWAFWVLGLACAGLTLLACHAAAARAAGRPAGLVAAGVWALASGDRLLQANQPNVEVFLNLFLAAAAAVLLGPGGERGSGASALAVGLLGAAATLYKQVAAGPLLALVTVDAVLGRRWRPAAISLGVLAGAWAAVAGWFAAAGAGAAFREAVFDYNRGYSGSIGANLLAGLGAATWGRAAFRAWLPLLAAAIALGLTGLATRRRAAALLLAWLGGSIVAMTAPGKLFPHYYQLLLAPAAVLAGLAASPPSLLGRALLVVAVLWGGAERVRQDAIPLAALPIEKYDREGVAFLEAKAVGEWIQERVPAEAVVYHWGPDPNVYLHSGRRPPARFSYSYPLRRGDGIAARWSAEELARLEAAPPDLVVATRADLDAGGHPIAEWIGRNYVPVAGAPGLTWFRILARPGFRPAAARGRRE